MPRCDWRRALGCTCGSLTLFQTGGPQGSAALQLPAGSSCSMASASLVPELRSHFPRCRHQALGYPLAPCDAPTMTQQEGELPNGSVGSPMKGTSPLAKGRGERYCCLVEPLIPCEVHMCGQDHACLTLGVASWFIEGVEAGV